MRLLAAILIGASIASPGTVDDWPAARVTNTFSENANYFVQIVPGSSFGDAVGFEGSSLGKYATASFYHRVADKSYQLVSEVTLVNPVAPVESIVSNSGSLITFDNWSNVGYGNVVAIYDVRGRLVRSWTLEQLYSPVQVRQIRASVSSRWWRCRAKGFVDPSAQTKVFVSESLGGEFTFRLDNGEIERHSGRAKCAP